MSILKNRTHGNYTPINNTILHDASLSLFDRGLVATIMSLPDGWNLSARGLAAILPDGVDAIRAGLIRLEKAGYLRRSQAHDSGGRFAPNVVEVFAAPQRGEEPETPENTPSEPCTGFPATVEPSTEKNNLSCIYNIYKNKKIKNNIYRAPARETHTVTSARVARQERPSPPPKRGSSFHFAAERQYTAAELSEIERIALAAPMTRAKTDSTPYDPLAERCSTSALGIARHIPHPLRC